MTMMTRMMNMMSGGSGGATTTSRGTSSKNGGASSESTSNVVGDLKRKDSNNDMGSNGYGFEMIRNDGNGHGGPAIYNIPMDDDDVLDDDDGLNDNDNNTRSTSSLDGVNDDDEFMSLVDGNTSSDDDGSLTKKKKKRKGGCDNNNNNNADTSGGGGDHHGFTPGTATNVQVCFNLIISFVGAGLLGLPYAFRQSGWLLGSIALCTVSAANVYCMLLLVQVRQRLEQLKQKQQQHLVKNHHNSSSSSGGGSSSSTSNNNISKDELDKIKKPTMTTSTTATTAIMSSSSSSLPPPAGSTGINGYGDLGREVMGPKGEILVNICLVVSQVGFSTAYIIFIAANLRSIYTDVNVASICLGCIPVLSVLVQAKEMKTLSPFSLLADFANLAGLSAVFFQDFEHYTPHNDTIHSMQLAQLTYVVSISIYSLEGIGLILPLESSCKDRTAFPRLLKSVIFGITILMIVFGICGYLAFGDRTLAPITLNLDSDGYSTFVKLALCIGLYFTYPIMMYPVHGVLEDLFGLHNRNNNNNKSKHGRGDSKVISLRVALVIMTAAIAYSIPDFGKFLGLVGSSICMLLGFILPCYFHIVVYGVDMPLWQRLLDYTLITLGFIFGISGTYHAILRLFNIEDSDDGGIER